MLERIARRATLTTLAALAVGASVGCAPTQNESTETVGDTSPDDGEYAAEFERLEQEYDARIGVYALDTGTDAEVTHHSDERFPFASTYKALACGAVMEQRTLEEMEEVVQFGSEDLVEYSPVTEEHVSEGMTLVELCDAAIGQSDNTAGNLLFDELGGTEGFQEAMAGLGDDVTQADRVETELNETAPDDTRDTTSPAAFGADLREYVLGDTLPKEERDLLREMLVGNATGDDLIRAGVPEGWEVGDKSGAGSNYGVRNDIAIAWPADSEPVVLAVMSSSDEKDAEYDDVLIAEATEVAVEALG